MLKTTSLLAIVFLFSCSPSFGQLIKKKEAEAIDQLLSKLCTDNKPGNYLISNTNLLTMTDSVILENRDVLITNGVIQEIGIRLNPSIEYEVIDGAEKYLMPGLTDMHVHLFHHHQMKNTWGLLLLTNGVTSVRDMAGEPEKLILRDKINNDEVLFPTIYQAGPIINGKGNQFGLVVAATPDEGERYVREQKMSGYDFIKVYNDLNSVTYKAIVNEAAKKGIPVVGHLPDAISLEEALNYQSSIEHLTGYMEWQNGVEAYLNVDAGYAQRTARSLTWNCPTFYQMMINWGGEKGAQDLKSEVSPFIPRKLQKRWMKMLNRNIREKTDIVNMYGDANQKLVSLLVINLYQANAKLIAGTDAGALPLIVPGITLLKELESLNELGIPIYDVLKMTTINAALAMNKESEFGTVEVGKRADLLLLNENPLENIDNLKNKSGVMIRGIWIAEIELGNISQEIQTIFGNK